VFNKIGIIGLGLIGGSLAKALKNRIGVKTIVALNHNEDVLKQAYKEGVIDAYTTDVNEIFSDCDIIFVCTPVSIIHEYIQKLTAYIKPDCIISDVGSTKYKIYERIKNISNKFCYIGGHPLTGSEKFRYSASKEHLFENAYYIITPAENVSEYKINLFYTAIKNIGAIPVIVSPEQHDYIVASISHVPQILASALCNNVQFLDTPQKHMYKLAAGGFKDITRIASSNTDMWENICFDNTEQIFNSLSYLEETIKNFKISLLEKDRSGVYNFFDNARQYRDSFSNITPKSFIKRYEIVIDILDKPGSIAIIAVLLSSNNINIKNMSIVNNRERENGVLYISFDSEEQRKKSISLLRDMNYEVQIKD